MSNWWKRLLGFETEDDDISEEKSSHQAFTNKSKSIPKGRIETSGKHIDVKMIRQYPKSYREEDLHRVNYNSPKKDTIDRATDKYDTPAFTRSERRRPIKEEQAQWKVEENSEVGLNANTRNNRQNDSSIKPEPSKHKKFKPTEIPSPIYGFKKPKKRKRPSTLNDTSLLTLDDIEKAKSLNNENRTSNKTDIHTHHTGYKIQSDSEVKKVKEDNQDTFKDSNHKEQLTSPKEYVDLTSILSGLQGTNSETGNTDVKTEPEPTQSSELETFSDEVKAPQNNIDKVETPQNVEVLDVLDEKEPVSKANGVGLINDTNMEDFESEDTRFTDNQESDEEVALETIEEDQDEASQQHSLVEIEEDVEPLQSSDTVLSQEVNESSQNDAVVPSEEKTTVPEKRKSSVPFNVLMFGADRMSMRRQSEKKQVSQTQNIKAKEDKFIAQEKPKKVTLTHELLNDPTFNPNEDDQWLKENQETLSETLKNFNVKADIVGYVQGPSVTRFELQLHPGVKINKILNLTEDIKLSMAAKQIRIAPVPGKSLVGIEIPNVERKPVFLKQLLESNSFINSHAPLTATLGMDISGQEVVTDLSKMPHGLIAGATGSGKSVCIHSLLLSLIYKTAPEDLRFILIDPKVVELAAYQYLPHLAAPLITQPKEAALALKWAVEEMENRYQQFAKKGVRDINRFNQAIDPSSGESRMPYIVIVIDELADLMMASPQDVEEAICRIAQKARAAGIHMLLATQRPSVDVITGLIKSNIPTRIAFSVSSQADSRTILDAGGAERLLGQGDMLFVENGARDMKRLQGAFVTDEEIDRVTDALKKVEPLPYLFDLEQIQEMRTDLDTEEDELFEEAALFVIDQGQASVSSLQRRFRIGYNRAARLVDQLEAIEVISESNGSKPRQILVDKENFQQYYHQGKMNPEMSS